MPVNYTTRSIEQRLWTAFDGSMITGLLGPRRVGKSTLLNQYIKEHPELAVVSLNMDRLSERQAIQQGELETIILTTIQRHLEPNRLVLVAIDEAQKSPELFDQIKLLYDRYKDQNAIKFIITGSALLDLHRLSAESLAGRINLYYLSAFNLCETVGLLHHIDIQPSIFTQILSAPEDEKQWNDYFHALTPYSKLLQQALVTLQCWGGLPEVLLANTIEEKLDYLDNYLQTYLEKDVRAIHSITDLNLYRHLMEITAAQTGSIRDDSRILQALGCHRETLQKYRGYLSATLLYEEVSPYINSVLTRLVKAPKGYLINNGLVSFLQGIYDPETLLKTGQMGHRLENWFLSELDSWLNHHPGHHRVHYWRTTGGAEVDFVMHAPPHIIPFEITSSSHIEPKKVRNLLRFRDYEPNVNFSFYIYMGEFKFDAANKIIFLPAWAVCQ
jgi:predicted AAA+ superfamily ATPase